MTLRTVGTNNLTNAFQETLVRRTRFKTIAVGGNEFS